MALETGGTRTPLRTQQQNATQSSPTSNVVYRDGPFNTWDWLEEFDGPIPSFTRTAPFIDTAANVDINKFAATAVASVAYVVAPCNGVISEIGFVAEDAVVQHATNNITFTGLNKLGAGVGAVAVLGVATHVNTTDTNAAALNGGADLTAKEFWPLSLSLTAANLRVTKGDVIEITATVANTPAIVDAPQLYVTFQSAADIPASTVTRIAGTPLVQRVTGKHEAVYQLGATNEVQNAFYTWNDVVAIDPTLKPVFWCRFKVGTVTTAQTVVIGLASAFSATLSNIVSNVWLRLNASLTPLLEGDDGTTDTDAKAVAGGLTTLVSGAYYHLRIGFEDLSAVTFHIDGNLLGTVSVPLLTASTLLMPIAGIQKASGTGQVAVNVDYLRCRTERF